MRRGTAGATGGLPSNEAGLPTARGFHRRGSEFSVYRERRTKILGRKEPRGSGTLRPRARVGFPLHARLGKPR